MKELKCKECIRSLDGTKPCHKEAVCDPNGPAELFLAIGGPLNSTAPTKPKTKQVLPVAPVAPELTMSDGSTADYYEIPIGTYELQTLISFLNCNAQLGEIGRAWMRYGRCAHSTKKRDIKKIIFYAQAELARLEKYENG